MLAHPTCAARQIRNLPVNHAILFTVNVVLFVAVVWWMRKLIPPTKYGVINFVHSGFAPVVPVARLSVG